MQQFRLLRVVEVVDVTPVIGLGLTGSETEIRRVTEQYGSHFSVEETDSAGGYTIDHSTFIFLIDQEGVIRYLFRHSDKPQVMAAVIAQLL